MPFAECKDQFMLGDKYLVAPMVTQGNSRTVKLPKGKWKDDLKKLNLLLVFGCIALLLGYGLDGLNMIPIIKRISTGSFVLVSTGWVLLIFAFIYWIIDLKGKNKYAWIATVVGMNAIFIYQFFETVGVQWLNPTTAIFIGGFTSLLHVTPTLQVILSAFAVWFIEWYLCYWLAKNRIFINL